MISERILDIVREGARKDDLNNGLDLIVKQFQFMVDVLRDPTKSREIKLSNLCEGAETGLAFSEIFIERVKDAIASITDSDQRKS